MRSQNMPKIKIKSVPREGGGYVLAAFAEINGKLLLITQNGKPLEPPPVPSDERVWIEE
jgi:hypothetical protein